MKQPANSVLLKIRYHGGSDPIQFMRIVLEKVQGAYGGIHLIEGLQSGVVRNQFNEQRALCRSDGSRLALGRR